MGQILDQSGERKKESLQGTPRRTFQSERKGQPSSLWGGRGRDSHHDSVKNLDSRSESGERYDGEPSSSNSSRLKESSDDPSSDRNALDGSEKGVTSQLRAK